MKIPKIKNVFTRKRITIFLIFLILIGLVFLNQISTKKTEKETLKISPTPLPSGSYYPTLKPASQIATEEVYFVNQIVNSSAPVTSYCWASDYHIYYTTPGGIYKVNDVEPVLKAPISSISWSSDCNAIFIAGNNFSFFKKENNSTIPINNNLIKFKLSPNGNMRLFYNDKNINLIIPATDESIKKDFEDNVNDVLWSGDSNFIIIKTKNSQENKISILDLNLEVKSEFTFGIDTNLLSVSPNAEYLILDSKENLIIHSISGKQTKVLHEKITGSSSVWLNRGEFIYIETLTDDLGRNFDSFFRINLNGDKKLLTNSMPIVRKVNMNLKPIISLENEAMLFAENNGKLWILSLLSNKLPTYSDAGLVLTPLESKSHEPVGP